MSSRPRCPGSEGASSDDDRPSKKQRGLPPDATPFMQLSVDTERAGRRSSSRSASRSPSPVPGPEHGGRKRSHSRSQSPVGGVTAGSSLGGEELIDSGIADVMKEAGLSRREAREQQDLEKCSGYCWWCLKADADHTPAKCKQRETPDMSDFDRRPPKRTRHTGKPAKHGARPQTTRTER